MDKRRISKKGDTLVETVLAMAILSLVLLTSWGLVNRAVQISLAARKRIEMVNQIKQQAEILKGLYAKDPLHQAFTTKQLGSGTPRRDATSIAPNPCDDSRGLTSFDNAFHMDVDTVAGTVKAVDDVEVINTDDKVWVQLVSHPKYLDFYIRGCWIVAGRQAEDNSQVIVRLNI